MKKIPGNLLKKPGKITEICRSEKVGTLYQGQSKISISLQTLCSPYSLQAGGLHSTEMLLVL